MHMEALRESTARAGRIKDYAALLSELGPGIAARGREHDERGSFVLDSFETLREYGFFTALVPSELGGPGVSHGEMCALLQRLGSYCGSTALAFAMHCHLVSTAEYRWRHQKAPTDGLLRRVLNENLVLCSSGGSDWLDSEGRAERVEGGFRISARKVFSSGCPVGNLLMTSAVYDDPEAGPSVLHFGVPFKAEGVKILDTWNVLGMRGSGSHDVLLDQVFVADAAIGGKRPKGKWHPLFHTISMVAFPLIYSAYLGVAEAARNKAIALAKKRASADLIAQVGALENAYTTACMARDRMVTIVEKQKPSPETTSATMVCRTLCGNAAIETVTRAMEIAGGNAFYRTGEIERLFRDIQGARFHPLRESAQLAYTGRLLLGLDVDGAARPA
jgi:alkylation response protein AidB-like acyl-CoA dehydrogenase